MIDAFSRRKRGAPSVSYKSFFGVARHGLDVKFGKITKTTRGINIGANAADGL